MIKGEKNWLGRLYWTVVPSCDEKEFINDDSNLVGYYMVIIWLMMVYDG